MSRKEMREVTIYSFSFKNLVKKSFSLKGFFNKTKKFVSDLGVLAKKGIDKLKIYVDLAVKYAHYQIDKSEYWLYVKLEEKFEKVMEVIIPEEVVEVLDEVIEEIIE